MVCVRRRATRSAERVLRVVLLASMQVMLVAAANAPSGPGGGDELESARREQASEDTGRRVPEHVDTNGDGRVSQEEFRDALARASPISPTHQGQPSARLQRGRRIRQYLEEHGIGVHNIPKALAVYESISMAFL